MRINVLITTYQRPEMLESLIAKLQGPDVYFTIVNDGSPYSFLPNIDCNYIELGKNHGKKEYWKVVNYAFENRVDADYYVMLPDDAGVDKDFVARAIEHWNHLNKDWNPICLNLLVDKSRKGKPCWTGFKPIWVDVLRIKYWITQWVDMCFICDGQFFEEIPSLSPIYITDEQMKTRGSGVGAQISKRLHEKGYNLWQLDETLVHHGTHESKLNSELRDQNPLIA